MKKEKGGKNLLDNDHKITLTLWGVLASVGQVAVVVELALQLVIKTTMLLIVLAANQFAQTGIAQIYPRK